MISDVVPVLIISRRITLWLICSYSMPQKSCLLCPSCWRLPVAKLH